jgi:hypothetical protein
MPKIVEYTLRVDEYSDIATYVGRALSGTSEYTAKWQVRKMLVDGDTTKILWADGNAEYDNNWSNHLSLNYW